MNHPGLIVGVPLGLFAVAWAGDRLERWLISLWVRSTHQALGLAVGPLVAFGFAAAVIMLAMVL